MPLVISKERNKLCHVCGGTRKIKQMVKGVMKEMDCPACGGKGTKNLRTK